VESFEHRISLRRSRPPAATPAGCARTAGGEQGSRHAGAPRRAAQRAVDADRPSPGLFGLAWSRFFAHRQAPLARLLADEIEARRSRGDGDVLVPRRGGLVVAAADAGEPRAAANGGGFRVEGRGESAAMETTPTEGPAAAPSVGPVRRADALGWASSVLGAPMVLVPRRFLRAIGIEDDGTTVAWTVGVGVREHLATLNIIANRQRRIGMWSRAVGDTMDLALLAAAYRYKRRDGARLRWTIGVIGAIWAVDLVTALQMTRADRAHVRDGSGSAGTGVDHDTGGGPTRVRTAVTIRRPEDEVRRAFGDFGWTAFDPAALEASGDVRFTTAPGDRGTEVHLDHEPRGGRIGATAAKVLGTAPDQVINDELRAFKALTETGTVPRSATSPEGPSSKRQILHKRPAQPVGGGR
jgi:hypothetical protein